MPELVEQLYCSQQIVIPPQFPYILKKFAKAAIKTQPYDLLRWSYEYFQALAENRAPPVKLRLEYPVFSSEGGLTRGYLKVLANQLHIPDLPIVSAGRVRALWKGACLDTAELRRLMCLASPRCEDVETLKLLAVAAGLLTKSLTQTMILLCETLTREPDGGSAAIPLEQFLMMYRFLAELDASRDCRFVNGRPEGEQRERAVCSELYENETEPAVEESDDNIRASSDSGPETQRLTVIDGTIHMYNIVSRQLSSNVLGTIERSPSVERANKIEWETYLRESGARVSRDETIEEKLRQLSRTKSGEAEEADAVKSDTKEDAKVSVQIAAFDENGTELPLEFYGEPQDVQEDEERDEQSEEGAEEDVEEEAKPEEKKELDVKEYVRQCYEGRQRRYEDMLRTFFEIAAIVDRCLSATYDLGMVAGRQMSTTSAEFIVQNIQKDIMSYINEMIAILPDPDLKKKKAKPEEVQMIRDLLQQFLDDNMAAIAPEVEEVEEEEEPIPEILTVYAIPGIGPPVDEEVIRTFVAYAQDVAQHQEMMFMPRNIRHFLCPPLEKLPQHDYEGHRKEFEEIAANGKME